MAQAVDKTGPAAERTDAGQTVAATAAEASSADPPAVPRAAAGPVTGRPGTRGQAAAQPRLRAWFGRRHRNVAPKPPALPAETVWAAGADPGEAP